MGPASNILRSKNVHVEQGDGMELGRPVACDTRVTVSPNAPKNPQQRPSDSKTTPTSDDHHSTKIPLRRRRRRRRRRGRRRRGRWRRLAVGTTSPPTSTSGPASPAPVDGGSLTSVGMMFTISCFLEGSRSVEWRRGSSVIRGSGPGSAPTCCLSTRWRSSLIRASLCRVKFLLVRSIRCLISVAVACWQKDASATKSLSFDGWFITLYSIELARFQLVLCDQVKQDVPSSWDPSALAEFIAKYGTHIIVGVKMGGKDVIYVKQQHESALQPAEVQMLLKKLADERFSEDFNGNFILGLELVRKTKDVVSIHVRRGGINSNQSHNQWLSTILEAPDVVSMSFVPMTALLSGLRGTGFLSHAVNLYLRYKPPIEELHQFLEFQLPRQWVPEFGELHLGPLHKQRSLPSLQFTLMGPRLHVNIAQVDSGNRPVTGIRLYLEGNKNNCLAIHLQCLNALPGICHLSDDPDNATNDVPLKERDYYEPIRWALLSHVCTAPVQYSGARIGESASIVTKAWLEVRDTGIRKVLFLRLGFSNVASMKIRRSEWDGPASFPRKSGAISALISNPFGTSQVPIPKPKVEVNSAVFPGGPPVPIRVPRLSKFVDTIENARGPDNLPGYWVVTGGKLCVEGGMISLKVKYSLLVQITDDDI